MTTSHTKKYELTHIARYSLVWFFDLGRISSVGLAQAFTVETLILSLWLRITEAGHLAVFHQNLSGDKAIPLQYTYTNSLKPLMLFVFCRDENLANLLNNNKLLIECVNMWVWVNTRVDESNV